MAKSDLAKYIAEVKKKGHPDHHIKHHLKNHGYPEHIIDHAYEELNKKYDIALYIMAGLVGLLIILIGFVFIKTLSNSSVFKGNDIICENTSIFIREYNNQKIICNNIENGYKIDFLVYNNGTDNIKEVAFNIMGNKKKDKFKDETPDLASDSGYVKSYDFDATIYGEIEKIEITPIIRKNKRDKFCKLKTIEINDFSLCKT